METVNTLQKNIKKVIEQLRLEASIHSLAHKESMYYFSKMDTNSYKHSIVSSLSSILFMLLGYNCSSSAILMLAFTVLSIVSGLYSLYCAIMANHKRYGFLSEEHRHLMNSYLHISIKSREAELSTKSDEEILSLVNDLLRDFRLLKVRGLEPDDEYFIKANAFIKKVKTTL
ncbi:MAG: hypothetical protein HQK53_15215 [Oligoflexia bacterium]|nr:hypothetical protein [Oligoflexia bacterium]